jgi:recombination protein RecR
LLENAVSEFTTLPASAKTAHRLYCTAQHPEVMCPGSPNPTRLRGEIKQCRHCHNLSDTEICAICADPARDHGTVCVVENIRDVMSIENTMQFRGVYHVLGGVISPMDGIGPADLTIQDLETKAASGDVREIILALSTTMEGDTTNFYIYRKIKTSRFPSPPSPGIGRWR